MATMTTGALIFGLVMLMMALGVPVAVSTATQPLADVPEVQ